MSQYGQVLVTNKRIDSFNTFGSRWDLVIWFCVVGIIAGMAVLMNSLFFEASGSAPGTFLGGGTAIIVMRVMLLPISGQLEQGSQQALHDRLMALGYDKSYLDANGRMVISRDVARWARWNAETVTIQKRDALTSTVIAPLSVMRKL